MNIALIFAGGTGTRMKTGSTPKQFLEVYGKSIIIYTIEIFENHPLIDGIVVVCVHNWREELKKQLRHWGIHKILAIVDGGATGQESIYNGLQCIKQNIEGNPLLLIHDGVRPLIDESVISANIQMAQKYGNCITCAPATETCIFRMADSSFSILDRTNTLLARAPQTFFLDDIMTAHQHALTDNILNFTDSSSLMAHYGYKLNVQMGPSENIKITTPQDYFVFKALLDLKNNQQVYG